MSSKRRKTDADSTHKSRHNAAVSQIPENAVVADPTRQAPNNSYDPPALYYVDKRFHCRDCGKDEVWTALQQKWYYEVAKGFRYATAVRCRDCRRKQAERNNGRGDPNPVKNLKTLFKHVRIAIGPSLAAAGFLLEHESQLPICGSFTFDFSRSGALLSCWYDDRNATFRAEILDELGNHTVIATVPINAPRYVNAPRYGDPILDRIKEFSAMVEAFLTRQTPELRGGF